MRQAVICFSLGFALLATTPLRTAEGRIPIFEPVVLTASGKYVVTRDITAPAGTRVIEVSGASTKVFEIDLNGFTLTSDFIVIDANNVKSIVIRNGTEEEISIPITEHPIMLSFPVFSVPSRISGKIPFHLAVPIPS